MKNPAYTNTQLIEILSKYPPRTPLVATWESISSPIEDVIYYNGEILLDVDGGWLRESIKKYVNE